MFKWLSCHGLCGSASLALKATGFVIRKRENFDPYRINPSTSFHKFVTCEYIIIIIITQFLTRHMSVKV